MMTAPLASATTLPNASAVVPQDDVQFDPSGRYRKVIEYSLDE